MQTHETFTVPCYDDRLKNQNRPAQTQTPSEDNTEFILQRVYPCQRASSHPFLISNFPLTLMSGSASNNDPLSLPSRVYWKDHQYIRTGINNAIDKRRRQTLQRPGQPRKPCCFINVRVRNELRQWQTDHSDLPHQAWRWCSHWQLVRSGQIQSGCGWVGFEVLRFGTGPK